MLAMLALILIVAMIAAAIAYRKYPRFYWSLSPGTVTAVALGASLFILGGLMSDTWLGWVLYALLFVLAGVTVGQAVMTTWHRVRGSKVTWDAQMIHLVEETGVPVEASVASTHHALALRIVASITTSPAALASIAANPHASEATLYQVALRVAEAPGPDMAEVVSALNNNPNLPEAVTIQGITTP